MNYLYLLLNIGSIAIPFAFTFHPKLKFYQHWRSFGIAVIISSILFIFWDILFTNNGIWGFNPTYLVGINLLNLPIEEWLFFICIPYACIFTHYAVVKNYPKLGVLVANTKLLTIILVASFLLIAIFNTDRMYTAVNFSLAALTLVLVAAKNIKLLRQYFITYVIIFFPFLVVNGVLTGSFIDGEVVWYNDDENLGIRLFTIPIEDAVYAFSLILIPLFIMKKLER